MTPVPKTYGYQADVGDIPPVAPSEQLIGGGRQRNSNDDYVTNERDPIFRNNEHSLPTLEQVRTEAANILARQQYSSNRFNVTSSSSSNNDDYSYGVPKSTSISSRKRMKCWISITTCAVALIVLISVLVSSKHKGSSIYGGSSNSAAVKGGDSQSYNDDNTNNNSNDDSSPEPQTPEQIWAAKRKSILELLQVKISYQNDMETVGTPQYKAVDWMVDDNYIEEVPSNSDSYDVTYPYIQRYVMAVFYYALNGPEWDNQSNFLNHNLSVCDWNVLVDKNYTTTADDYTFGVQCQNGDSEEITNILLSGNDMSGSLPDEMGDLLALQELSLYDNAITGKLPNRMQVLTDLWFVQLESNQFSGTIPSWLGSSLTSLEYLGLAKNNFTGTIPEAFMNLSNIKEIDFSYNDLTGSIALFDVETCPPLLKLVYVNNNRLDGRIHDASFAYCDSIIEIDFSRNELQGYFPQHFYNLTIVSLHHNNLTGQVEPVPQPAAAIEYLSLAHNQLTGSIPDSYEYLDSLKHLDLSDNGFTGTMPSAFDNMAQLEYLFLSDNEFDQGPIPYLGDTTGLMELSLANTNRTGEIPTWLGSMSSLALLDLHGNELSGTIPSVLSQLNELSFLFLNRNALTGTVPQSFANIGDTTEILFLDNNALNGTIDFICDASSDGALLFFTSDCAASSSINDESEITCKCCTKCCTDDEPDCNKSDRLERIKHSYSKDHYLYSKNLLFKNMPKD